MKTFDWIVVGGGIVGISFGNSREIPLKYLCLPIWFELEQNISNKVANEIRESVQ